MLLEGNPILVTGDHERVVAGIPGSRIAQEQGAEVVLGSFGRVMTSRQRAARRFPKEPRSSSST